MLLKDLGKAGAAVMILGAAACSSDSTPEPEPTDGSGPSPSTVPGSEPTSSTSAVGSTTTGVGIDWRQVVLGNVSAYLAIRNGEAALVDTGNPGSEDAIEFALGAAGLDWGALGHVIITHRHNDHKGSLTGVLALAPAASWYVGAADMVGVGADTEGIAVGDGDNVFGLDVIDTPGHTPGHVSVIDTGAGVLVAGDALFGSDGGVVGSLPQYTSDEQMADASVVKLAGFTYDVAYFGHGEPILSGASEAVTALAESL